MQLKVRLYTGDIEQGEINQVIGSFRDILRLGHDTARAVRDWLRRIPMTPHPKHHQVNLYAEWVEDKPKRDTAEQELAAESPRPKKKRKARK